MVRFVGALLVGLWFAGFCPAASWADAMFDELSRDFGSVPRGPTLTHSFRLTNRTGKPLHIGNVRVSCGCTTATPLQTELAPGATSAILVQMDTRRFVGIKTVTIYVLFDQPQWEEVRLWIHANSREDITLSPDSLDFGRIKRGSSPTGSVQVTMYGDGTWQILEAACESNYVLPRVTEMRRDTTGTVYQVSARIREDAPVGKWYTDVWLTTNNPTTPRLRIPLTVEIESALSVSPASAYLGQVHVGSEAERRVIVRGARPFRITGVRGADAQLTIRDSSPLSKPLHILVLKLKAHTPGSLRCTLQIFTDLPEDGEVDFQASALVLAQASTTGTPASPTAVLRR